MGIKTVRYHTYGQVTMIFSQIVEFGKSTAGEFIEIGARIDAGSHEVDGILVVLINKARIQVVQNILGSSDACWSSAQLGRMAMELDAIPYESCSKSNGGGGKECNDSCHAVLWVVMDCFASLFSTVGNSFSTIFSRFGDAFSNVGELVKRPVNGTTESLKGSMNIVMSMSTTATTVLVMNRFLLFLRLFRLSLGEERSSFGSKLSLIVMFGIVLAIETCSPWLAVLVAGIVGVNVFRRATFGRCWTRLTGICWCRSLGCVVRLHCSDERSYTYAMMISPRDRAEVMLMS